MKISNSIIALVVFSSVSSAFAQQVSKEELLRACQDKTKAEQISKGLASEMKIDTNIKLQALDKITSGDQVVSSLNKSMTQKMDQKSMVEGIRKVEAMRAVFQLYRTSYNKAIIETREKVGRNELVESAATLLMGSALEIVTNVADITLVMGKAKLNDITLKESQLTKMSNTLQTSLEKYAVAKVKLAGIQAKAEQMTASEKKAAQANAAFLTEKAQTALCIGMVNLARK